MRSYNRNGRSGGGRRSGGDFRRRDSGRREMHKAVCDECGNNCEVPFKPSGDKPIYCSNCFEGKEGGGFNRPRRKTSGGSGFEKSDNTNKQLLEKVESMNEKLGRILQALESSVEEKPVIKKAEVKKVVKKVDPKEKKSKKKIKK